MINYYVGVFKSEKLVDLHVAVMSKTRHYVLEQALEEIRDSIEAPEGYYVEWNFIKRDD